MCCNVTGIALYRVCWLFSFYKLSIGLVTFLCWLRTLQFHEKYQTSSHLVDEAVVLKFLSSVY